MNVVSRFLSDREGVGAASLESFLVRGPLVQSRHPLIEIGVCGSFAECAGHLADEAHLYISAGQTISDQELPAFQRAIDVAEVIGDLTLDAWRQRRAS